MMDILKIIGNIAEEHKIKAYAVGGSVRDIQMGKKDFDIDITVEGDSVVLGRLLQKRLGGKLRIHPEFGTASLILPTVKIDCASCREEEYPIPGKLPVVKKSKIEKDLKRRDFTINTLALDLVTYKIIDLFNGKQDIKARTIKILHPKSFIDDPTRVFRAIRFAGKLEFKIESKTAQLAREAVRAGLIQKLTPHRIRTEVILIFKETSWYKILKIMDEYDILNVLNLILPSPEVVKNIDQNIKLREAKSCEVWFIRLLATLGARIPSPLFACTKRELQKIERTYNILENIDKLKVAKLASEVYDFLEYCSDEELVFIISAVPEAKDKIMNFLRVYRQVKLLVSGKDLLKIGIKSGPEYKKFLSLALHAKLDGELKTKEEELQFIRQKTEDRGQKSERLFDFN